MILESFFLENPFEQFPVLKTFANISFSFMKKKMDANLD